MIVMYTPGIYPHNIYLSKHLSSQITQMWNRLRSRNFRNKIFEKRVISKCASEKSRNKSFIHVNSPGIF